MFLLNHGKSGLQGRRLGVLNFQMIPPVRTHPSGGTPKIHGSWVRVIAMVMMAFATVLECVQRTTRAIVLDGKMRMRHQPRVRLEVQARVEKVITCGGSQPRHYKQLSFRVREELPESCMWWHGASD